MVHMYPEDESNYPNLMLYASSELSDVWKNVEIWEAFRKWGQFDNETDAKRAINQWTDSPFMKVKPLGRINGRFDTDNPDQILLASEVACLYEKFHHLSDIRDLVESTILHELVHWGDNFDGNHQMPEAGKSFEIEAYGDDVNRPGFLPGVATCGCEHSLRDATTPRPPSSGIRNNNPGHISNELDWKGLDRGAASDGQTAWGEEPAMFTTPELGIRAMILTLMLKHQELAAHGKAGTLRELMTAWGKHRIVEVDQFVEKVNIRTDCALHEPLDLNSYICLKDLVEAMIYAENGQQPYKDRVLKKALKKARKTWKKKKGFS